MDEMVKRDLGLKEKAAMWGGQIRSDGYGGGRTGNKRR